LAEIARSNRFDIGACIQLEIIETATKRTVFRRSNSRESFPPSGFRTRTYAFRPRNVAVTQVKLNEAQLFVEVLVGKARDGLSRLNVMLSTPPPAEPSNGMAGYDPIRFAHLGQIHYDSKLESVTPRTCRHWEFVGPLPMWSVVFRMSVNQRVQVSDDKSKLFRWFAINKQ